MITSVQQYNSTNFTAKLPTKKAVTSLNKVVKTPKASKKTSDVIDFAGLDKALDDFYTNVKKNPKAVMQNIKLAGKAVKEAFKVNWKFYFG